MNDLSNEQSVSSAIDDIARGAWTRLRNLIGALDRVDRLETSTEFDGWLQGLAKDDAALDATLQEFLLRALRLTADPANFQILARIRDAGKVSPAALLDSSGLQRVELVERVNELSRAGLTVQALDRAEIEVTPLALGLIALVKEITTRMKQQAESDHLLNPKGKFSNPNFQIPISKLEPK